MVEKKNPVNIELVGKDEFRLTMKLDNWDISKRISEKALMELQELINEVTGLTKISECFNCSGEESKKIKEFWNSINNRQSCNECKFKWKECHSCVVKCESPLERTLLLELCKNSVYPILQRRYNKDGSYYEYPQVINFDNILTIPDFYLENKTTKLCVYADGHTYHERTEVQALRDRNIDRELQKLGFIVLRFTGLEIRKNCSQVVENIKSVLN